MATNKPSLKDRLIATITRHPFEVVMAVGLSFVLPTLLAYSGKHTADLLASYSDPWWLGYGGAFGIEILVVLISLKIGREMAALYRDRLAKKELDLGHVASLVWQIITLGIVTMVSIIANIVQGYHVKYGQDLTVQRIPDIDPAQMLAGILATALIPIVTLAVSEIIAGLVRDLGEGVVVVASAPKEDKKPEPKPAPAPVPPASNITPFPVCAHANEKCKGELKKCPKCADFVCSTHAPGHARHQHKETATNA